MSAAKIRKGDKVVVLSGRDKGKTGEVDRVDAQGRQGDRVRRQRRDPPPKPTQLNPQGGLERKEAPMHRLEGRDRRPQGRQGDPRPLRNRQDGKKVRVAARSGEKIDG